MKSLNWRRNIFCNLFIIIFKFSSKINIDKFILLNVKINKDIKYNKKNQIKPQSSCIKFIK